MNKDRISKAFFFVVLLLLLGEAGYLLLPFFGPLLCALMTAIVCYPLHRRVGKKFKKISPTVQALFSDLAVFLFLLVPATLLVITMINEVQTSFPAIENHIHHLFQSAQEMASKGQTSNSLMDRLRPYTADIQAKVSSIGERGIGSATAIATGMAKNLFGFLVDAILFLIVLFFLFKDGASLFKEWDELLPLAAPLRQRIHEKIRVTVEGVVRGAVVMGVIQGILFLIAYLIIGFPAAVLFSVLTALAGLLPGIGSGIIWIPLAIYYAATGSVWKGVVLIVCGILNTIVDGFIRPWLVGRNADMSFLWLMFAVLGGLEVFGAKGLILGPLVFALLPVFLDFYRSFLHDRTSIL